MNNQNCCYCENFNYCSKGETLCNTLEDDKRIFYKPITELQLQLQEVR